MIYSVFVEAKLVVYQGPPLLYSLSLWGWHQPLPLSLGYSSFFSLLFRYGAVAGLHLAFIVHLLGPETKVSIVQYPLQLYDVCTHREMTTGRTHGLGQWIQCEPDLSWDSSYYPNPICSYSNRELWYNFGLSSINVNSDLLSKNPQKVSVFSLFFNNGHQHKWFVLAFVSFLVWAIIFPKPPRAIPEAHLPCIPGVLPGFKSYITGECSYINKFFHT